MPEDQVEESEAKRSPSSKVIAELLHEEPNEEKSPVIENQAMLRTNKTVKTLQKKKKAKPKKEESPFREIPIIVESSTAAGPVADETAAEPEVDFSLVLV